MAMQCECGGLKPRSGEKPIPSDESPEAVMNEVRLHCDDTTGVFFFRSGARLYMRVVECDEE